MTQCVICGEPFPPRNVRSVTCGQPECVAERKRQYVRKCRAKDPDQARLSARRYYAEHGEAIKRQRIHRRRMEGRT